MEALLATVTRSIQEPESRKRYLRYLLTIATIATVTVVLLLGKWHSQTILVICLIFFPPRAIPALMNLGMSNFYAQILVTATSLMVSILLCGLGLHRSYLKHPWYAAYIAEHRWVRKLPYVAIFMIGIALPPGGVMLGIFIARATQLPKTPATAVILTANLLMVSGWGPAIVALLKHL